MSIFEGKAEVTWNKMIFLRKKLWTFRGLRCDKENLRYL